MDSIHYLQEAVRVHIKNRGEELLTNKDLLTLLVLAENEQDKDEDRLEGLMYDPRWD